jgi:hypothetical protein
MTLKRVRSHVNRLTIPGRRPKGHGAMRTIGRSKRLIAPVLPNVLLADPVLTVGVGVAIVVLQVSHCYRAGGRRRADRVLLVDVNVGTGHRDQGGENIGDLHFSVEEEVDGCVVMVRMVSCMRGCTGHLYL